MPQLNGQNDGLFLEAPCGGTMGLNFHKTREALVVVL